MQISSTGTRSPDATLIIRLVEMFVIIFVLHSSAICFVSVSMWSVLTVRSHEHGVSNLRKLNCLFNELFIKAPHCWLFVHLSPVDSVHKASVMRKTFPCYNVIITIVSSLQWHHIDRDGVSNHQPHICLLNRLFRHRSKLRITGPCAGNSPVTGGFPAQTASGAENVSIWWCHHVLILEYFPLQPVQNLNFDSGQWMNVFFDFKFQCSAKVTGWNFYVKKPGKFYACVWRIVSKEGDKHTIKLIGKNAITVDSTGVKVR